MFVKGYKQTKEHQLNAKLSRLKRHGSGICPGCGMKFKKYSEDQVCCGKKTCSVMYIKNQKKEQKVSSPILYKAWSLSGSIRFGKGKKAFFVTLVSEGLGKPCPYCGTTVTLENMSIDHKVPRTGSKVYNRKTKHQVYSTEEMSALDTKENLQTICRKCNSIKGNMSDVQFRSLLSFLDQDPILKELVMKRLTHSYLFFKDKGFKKWRT